MYQLWVVVALMLSACGGDSSNTATNGNGLPTQGKYSEYIRIQATAGGAIEGAAVTVQMANGGDLGISTVTDSSGTTAFTYRSDYKGPLLITIVATETSRYYDPVTQTSQPYRGILRVYTTGLQRNIVVTPITELAAAPLHKLGAAISAEHIARVNSLIAAMLVPEIADITATIRTINTATDILQANNDDLYALRILALASMDSANAALQSQQSSQYQLESANAATLQQLQQIAPDAVLTILQQLTIDYADGDIDGSGFGSNPTGATLQTVDQQLGNTLASSNNSEAQQAPTYRILRLDTDEAGNIVPYTDENGAIATSINFSESYQRGMQYAANRYATTTLQQAVATLPPLPSFNLHAQLHYAGTDIPDTPFAEAISQFFTPHAGNYTLYLNNNSGEPSGMRLDFQQQASYALTIDPIGTLTVASDNPNPQRYQYRWGMRTSDQFQANETDKSLIITEGQSYYAFRYEKRCDRWSFNAINMENFDLLHPDIVQLISMSPANSGAQVDGC